MAQVSTGTVDRVLHQRQGVSEKTRKKVQKLIDLHGIQINPIGRSLSMTNKIRLATLIPKANDQQNFWQRPQIGITKAAKELKAIGIQVDHFYFDQFSADSYVSVCQEIIKKQPNGLLIAPIFKQETVILAQKLNETNIPYLFINTDIDNLNNLSFVGQNSYQAGFTSGRLMKLALPEPAEILIVKIRQNVSNFNAIEGRITGFTDYVTSLDAHYPIREIRIDAIENRDFVAEVLQQTIQGNPLVRGIFVPSSNVGKIAGVIEVSKPDQPIKLIGFDGMDENVYYLKSRVIDFIIDQKPIEQGYNGLKHLSDYVTNNAHLEKYYYTPIEILMKENI